MGAMIPVLNMTKLTQHVGHYKLEPGVWTEVSYEVAKTLVDSNDFRADSLDLMGDFKFIEDGGTYLGWSSPIVYTDGYGSIGQEIADMFLKMGVALSITTRDYTPSHPWFGSIPFNEWVEKAYVPQRVVDRLGQPQDKCFYGINLTFPPQTCNHPFVRGIGYTMFETTAPPLEWVKPMNLCRRIVVPCRQNKEAFERRGVTVPIDVVPLGVNPDAYPYVDRTKYAWSGKPFTFLMAAGITYRKDPLLAAQAFVAAFPKEHDVQLVLKTRGLQSAGGFHAWKKYLPNDPRIKFVAEDSTPGQMLSWMHGAAAFVFPSHGEGFGLTPLQAMATGLPTIVSNNSGMSEYCDSRYNYPIPCKEAPIPANNHGGYPPEWGDVGNWWDADFTVLVKAYQDVYRHRNKAWEKGAKAAKWVRDNWTVKHTCEGLLDVVMQDAREDGLSY